MCAYIYIYVFLLLLFSCAIQPNMILFLSQIDLKVDIICVNTLKLLHMVWAVLYLCIGYMYVYIYICISVEIESTLIHEHQIRKCCLRVNLFYSFASLQRHRHRYINKWYRTDWVLHPNFIIQLRLIQYKIFSSPCAKMKCKTHLCHVHSALQIFIYLVYVRCLCSCCVAFCCDIVFYWINTQRQSLVMCTDIQCIVEYVVDVTTTHSQCSYIN